MVSPIRSKRRDQCTVGFFDLPAEIRLAIYELYCELIAPIPWRKRCHLDSWAIPYDSFARTTWENYSQHLIKAQLLCRQFRQEFVPTWASVSVFQLHIPPPAEYPTICKLPNLSLAWLKVRDFLKEIDPLARPHVQHIKICCESYVFRCQRKRDTAHFCRQHMAILGRGTGEELQHRFERFSDVNPELKIEFELICIQNRYTYMAAKRSYTLQHQSPETVKRTGSPDWLCTIGPLYYSNCTCSRGYHHRHPETAACPWQPLTSDEEDEDHCISGT